MKELFNLCVVFNTFYEQLVGEYVKYRILNKLDMPKKQKLFPLQRKTAK